MTLLTVVEASGLSGLAPEAIRAMVERGELQARAVPLPSGPAYLIEADHLRPFGVERLEADRPLVADLSAPMRPTALEQALSGVQAALEQLRRERWPAGEGSFAPPAPARAVPSGRSASGLGQAELAALAARMDRLMAPPEPVRSVERPTDPASRPGWWRRLFHRAVATA